MAYLPGQHLPMPNEVVMCDDHPDVIATKRIVADCDSFGHEEVLMCDECYAEYQKQLEEAKHVESTCDWCNSQTLDVRPFRDIEEGTSGRVYDVCLSCRTKANS